MDTVTPSALPAARHRHLATAVPGPRSQELHRRRAAAVTSAVASLLPVYVAEGGEGTLTDVDGNRFIDLGSGIAVTGVGNPAPAVARGVAAQAAAFTHTCFMITPYEGYVEVCEELAALTPGTHEKRSALVNSGAEAVENAVKVARRATGRQGVVVVEHAFHGRTYLTMTMTAKNMPYRDGFGPFVAEVHRVPASYPFRDGLPGPDAARRATALIESEIGARNVACVVVEPIQGEGGFVVPAPGFLPALAQWCTANGVVFVADEVQTGFCRTGAWFASEHEDVVPDIVVTAKGMAGGMPLGGITGRAELMDAVHPSGLGGTYGGNPVSCAAALGAIATMRERDLAAAARRIEAAVVPRLRALAERVPAIGDVRGRGAMLAAEFVRPGTAGPDAVPDPAFAKAVASACHAEGVVVLTCGTHGNVVRLLPPLVIADDVLDEGLGVLEAAITDTAITDTARSHP
ncbi:4-aminobutyrate--2-oxoglutarate transaminase [Pseudonocardia sp.]|uniref:4-aminobutyrate--2-oxoglutarate transaminase n=1 Tax=Pseudonocardia sp. TaxID=60912 RepID=UPI003D0A5D0D